MKAQKIIALLVLMLFAITARGQREYFKADTPYTFYYYENFGGYSMKVAKGTVNGEGYSYKFYDLCNRVSKKNFRYWQSGLLYAGNLQTLNYDMKDDSDYQFYYNKDSTINRVLYVLKEDGETIDSFVINHIEYDSLKRPKRMHFHNYLNEPGFVYITAEYDADIFWEYGPGQDEKYPLFFYKNKPIKFDIKNTKLVYALIRHMVGVSTEQPSVYQIKPYKAKKGVIYYAALIAPPPIDDVIYACDFINPDYWLDIYTLKNCNLTKVTNQVLPEINKPDEDGGKRFKIILSNKKIIYRLYKCTGYRSPPKILKEIILKFDRREKKFYIDTVYTNTLPGRYAYASYRKLTREEAEEMSLKSLREMRNEIYARHGYPFSSKSGFRFVGSQWYKKIPKKTPQKAASSLSAIERHNVKLILSVEKKKKKRK